MKFKLELDLGNDALQSYADVAKTLTSYFDPARFTNEPITASCFSSYASKIYDANGNVIGTFTVTSE